MRKIAVIGLGIMGHGIADNFVKNGYEVMVWNRDSKKTADLVSKGAKLAESPEQATAYADIVFEVTANDESSKDIWLGKNGILAASEPGQFVITCATLSVKWVNELAEKCQAKELIFFDMPMTGSRIGAETGNLVLLVGGNEDKLAIIAPDLEAISRNVRYFGDAGSGTKYKLILNSLQAIHLSAMGQALNMAKAVGLDQKAVAEALIEIPGGAVTKAAWEAYLNQPDPIGFSVDWITKDLLYARQMMDDEDLPLLDEIIKTYKTAIERGYGQSDWTIINEI